MFTLIVSVSADASVSVWNHFQASVYTAEAQSEVQLQKCDTLSERQRRH